MNCRAAVRIVGVLGLFAIIGPVHVLTKAFLGRSPWPRLFLAAVAWIVGARVHVKGAPLSGYTLLIANHTSWLDILVLAGATGCRFVSKDELGHGLLHWLADQNATVYVRRSHVKSARDQAFAIANALEGEKPVALFPETTTGPGTYLLPFRSTLLEAANFAAQDVVILPVAIDYGGAKAEVAWWHEPGMKNVMRMLGRAGTLTVTVNLLDPLGRGANRKQLAAKARDAIAETLGLTSEVQSPIGAGE